MKKYVAYLAGKMSKPDRAWFYQMLMTRGDKGNEDRILDIVDPTSKPDDMVANGDFVHWDIEAVRNADFVIVLDTYIGKGTAAEMGLAYALGKRILVYTTAKFIHPFVLHMASFVTTDLETLVDYLVAFLATGNWVDAYYTVYDR